MQCCGDPVIARVRPAGSRPPQSIGWRAAGHRRCIRGSSVFGACRFCWITAHWLDGSGTFARYQPCIGGRRPEYHRSRLPPSRPSAALPAVCRPPCRPLPSLPSAVLSAVCHPPCRLPPSLLSLALPAVCRPSPPSAPSLPPAALPAVCCPLCFPPLSLSLSLSDTLRPPGYAFPSSYPPPSLLCFAPPSLFFIPF